MLLKTGPHHSGRYRQVVAFSEVVVSTGLTENLNISMLLLIEKTYVHLETLMFSRGLPKAVTFRTEWKLNLQYFGRLFSITK